MKVHLVGTSLLILLLPVHLHSFLEKERLISSRVVAVSVYTDRAVVTRIAEGDLPIGDQTIVIPKLPSSLVDQSIRVSGEGVASARILDVKVETLFLDTIPEERTRELLARLEELQAEARVLTDQMGVLNHQKDFITHIQVQSADQISKELKIQRPTVADWQKILNFIFTNLSQINGELRQVEKKKSELQLKINAVQKEIDETRAYSRRSEKRLLLSLNVSKPGTFKLMFSYLVPGARWSPMYDARFSLTDKRVSLTYFGLVRQSTGEDWNDVDLTLSTARPSLGGGHPELDRWYVDVYRPSLSKQRALRDEAEAANVEEKYKAGVAAPVPMELAVAAVETRATSAVFHIGAKSTILTDNKEHKVTIAVETLGAEFEYSAVPKLVQNAFLKATVTNTTDYPFLKGNLNVFFENDYITTSSIETRVPTEKFDLSLGVDEGIKMERKLIKKFTESTGLFSKSVKLSYEYLITVENLKKSREKILIKDQVPISRSEQVVVEILEPKDLPKDPNGVLTWRLELKPGEKRDLKLKYTVEFPRDVQVIGLE